MGNRALDPPTPWTSWRDRRDGTVITVVRVTHWGRRLAAMPRGGHGSVHVEVDGAPRWNRIQVVNEWDWPNFELIYDPYEDTPTVEKDDLVIATVGPDVGMVGRCETLERRGNEVLALPNGIVSQSMYPDLYKAVADLCESSDETFQLPDLRNRSFGD